MQTSARIVADGGTRVFILEEPLGVTSEISELVDDMRGSLDAGCRELVLILAPDTYLVSRVIGQLVTAMIAAEEAGALLNIVVGDDIAARQVSDCLQLCALTEKVKVLREYENAGIGVFA
jgi:hypothetical protein